MAFYPSRLAPTPFRRCCASACVSLPPTSDFGVTGRRDQSVFAFGFHPHQISTRQAAHPSKAPEGWRTPRRFAQFDRRRNSRSVWTSAFATLRRDVAVTSAPLFVRTRNIHHSSLSARPTAPLKPAHSKRFAHFGSHHTTRQHLRRPSAVSTGTQSHAESRKNSPRFSAPSASLRLFCPPPPRRLSVQSAPLPNFGVASGNSFP